MTEAVQVADDEFEADEGEQEAARDLYDRIKDYVEGK
jgi:hypothetical protein